MTTISEDPATDVGLRERKKQQTRDAIHEAAFRLIEANGLDATTIEQICHEADVSTRTFFNYFPTKAAAALELPGANLDAEVHERFRTAQGSLVAALCRAIGSNSDRGPNRQRMKQLVLARPELMTTLTQMMHEVRGQYIALASERASSPEVAELAVTLVMTAMNRVMHQDPESDEPLGERLLANVNAIVGVYGEELA
jgi:AcrR family transcriptional regulator